tara:strand:- start:38372 stop:38944 length:573 start_codon:yes stop_codon:yes gene_type:complete
MTDSDARLIERVRAGNIAAFDELVNKYKQRIFAIVYNMTSNREDAADLTQDCFIKAFRSLDRFKGRSHFFTWLYRIAVNATLSHLKRNRYRRFFSFENLHEEGISPDLVEALSSKMQTERPVMLGELQEKLNEALQSLSPKHRTVVVLFEIEGLGHEEISEIVQTSVGTVRSRLHYAKRELQASLQAYLG